ncbi:pectate lyase [Tautonia sociabilis]|uniref:Polysaccharide lyase n=1 Tax=Tautonia sociabilis TaxID=2080755 RepID=A0A432MEX8_9BACT|nr:pectate lyase [Tautonia sociabilis]RUL84313.1 polysaccharide lyase [Tautonia sociabilis]
MALRPWLLLFLLVAPMAGRASARQGEGGGRTDPPRDEALLALKTAIEFFHWEVSSHGGYVWRYSSDLTSRRGEAVVGPTTVWVQPPGTPSVGEAMLDAYLASNDPDALDAARDAAYALCKGQMHSGGWDYSIEFDPSKRPEFDYRENPNRPTTAGRNRRRTTLDDDTTQASIRFLVRLDEALGFEDARIHDAASYALDAVLRAQYPNGGWYVWWDRFPEPPSEQEYPVLAASFPETWLREWPNTWEGRYVTNDNLMSDLIDTLLLAHRTYGEQRYLDSARKAGDFLVLAQLPEPQPAWAQQYNVAMHPEWSRKFEPPAVTGGESQGILQALMRLYDATGEETYLEPIPRALEYLRRSRLPDGRLARFYELETNRPLYFTKDYTLTDSSDDMPTHYGFIVSSRLDRIAAEYEAIRARGRPAAPEAPGPPRLSSGLAERAREAIAALDGRGAWVEEADNGSPIINSATFIRNVRVLADYLAAVDAAAESR